MDDTVCVPIFLERIQKTGFALLFGADPFVRNIIAGYSFISIGRKCLLFG